MCLIVFAWQLMPASPLVAAANRDEFYDRPAASAQWWKDHPHIYAGRDLQGGGTWMGVTKCSRFAAITNVRAPSEFRADAPSRGALVKDYLASDISPQKYIEKIAKEADPFNGYNLLIGNRDTLIWYSNRGQSHPQNGKPLEPGIYGLSNALLNDPWHKVVKTRAQFTSLLYANASEEAYFDMLSDSTLAPDTHLPRTGVDIPTERMLSAVCIHSPGYGTRSSTLVRMHPESGATLKEVTIR
ncbi:MAG: NRDE family protein [Oxalobacter sp.]|nr:MAG: NRDE family protein [Oxalobacter sp.]